MIIIDVMSKDYVKGTNQLKADSILIFFSRPSFNGEGEYLLCFLRVNKKLSKCQSAGKLSGNLIICSSFFVFLDSLNFPFFFQFIMFELFALVWHGVPSGIFPGFYTVFCLYNISQGIFAIF